MATRTVSVAAPAPPLPPPSIFEYCPEIVSRIQSPVGFPDASNRHNGLSPGRRSPSIQLGLILETNDPERVWNAFRLADTALDEGHSVETFLLADGVVAPDLEHETFNPRGVIRKYDNNGGALFACGTCMDSRDLEPDDLRPRSTMGACLRIVEEADEVLTIG